MPDTDWFWQYVNLSKIVLCLEARELHSLYNNIYIFCVVVWYEFF